MYGVKEMCRVFGVSRSRYYAQVNSGGSKRQREDQALLVSIKASFEGSDKPMVPAAFVGNFASKGLRRQESCLALDEAARSAR
jgi:hypothetical protein